MKGYLITFRSVTFAQKAQRAVEKVGIFSILRRTPKNLSRRGCGYCLEVHPAQIGAVKLVLAEEGLEYGKCYAIRPDGGLEEAAL